MVEVPSVTQLEKTGFPSLGQYYLCRGFGYEWDFVFTSPSQCWDFIGLDLVKVLCMLSQSL